MLTMMLSTYTGSMRLALAGNVRAKAVPEIDRFIKYGKQIKQRVALDLGEVTLIDPPVVQFLAEQLKRGVELVNCPAYIVHWILREATDESET